jgi:hypothetical protein
VLCEDGERVLCRGWRDDGNGNRTAVLAVLSASEHPSAGLVDRLAHEYGLKDELDGRSAVRPLALVREYGRTVLLLEDPGGEPLDRLLATYGDRKVLTLRHPPAPSDTDKFIWWTQQSGCKG